MTPSVTENWPPGILFTCVGRIGVAQRRRLPRTKKQRLLGPFRQIDQVITVVHRLAAFLEGPYGGRLDQVLDSADRVVAVLADRAADPFEFGLDTGQLGQVLEGNVQVVGMARADAQVLVEVVAVAGQEAAQLLDRGRE